jgi:hypothetical protein
VLCNWFLYVCSIHVFQTSNCTLNNGFQVVALCI